MDFKDVIESVGKTVEAAGVAVIVIGIALTGVRRWRELHRDGDHDGFRRTRQAVARSILLGLELLIAGDIIRTVAVEPTLESLGVLAIIVLIRTFLSVELELEIDGRWPWQRPGADDVGRPS
jgi:uncharacterized membrane protein